MALKIVFAGTPDFAAVHLQALIDSEHDVVAVYSQPDRPAKRGKKLQASAVKQVAVEHNIPVLQPLNFRAEEDVQALKDLAPDVMVVVAYGLILPEVVLQTPRHGCLNVHASLLPRWRGAAPIQRAIEAGDNSTGITIMQMDIGLDTGDMLNTVTTPIFANDTGGSLHDRLADLGPRALLSTLTDIESQSLKPQSQDDQHANYAHKLAKQEAFIDWQTSASQLALRIRAFNPFPMCFAQLGDQRLRIISATALDESHTMQPGTIARVDKQGLDVVCQQGVLRITQLQLAGKKPMAIHDVINGQPQLLQPLYVMATEL